MKASVICLLLIGCMNEPPYDKPCNRVVDGICVIDSGPISDELINYVVMAINRKISGLDLVTLADEYNLSFKYVDVFTYPTEENTVGVYYPVIDAIEILNHKIVGTFNECQINGNILNHELLHFVAERYLKDNSVHDVPGMFFKWDNSVEDNRATKEWQIDEDILNFCYGK